MKAFLKVSLAVAVVAALVALASSRKTTPSITLLGNGMSQPIMLAGEGGL